MNPLRHWKPLFPVPWTLALLLTVGCSSSPTGTPGSGSGDRDAAFQEVLDSGGDFDPVTESREETVLDSDDELQQDGEVWICTRKQVSAVNAPQDYSTFDPNAEVIYPGSLLQGRSLAQATPDPISVRRAGGTLSIDLINGSSQVTATVEEVSESAIRQAMNDIIANNNGIGSARFTFEQFQVHSREQLAAHLDVNVSTLTSDFNAAMEFSRDREYTRWMVRLDQSYYTILFNKPTSLSDVFAPEVTPGDLGRYVQPGNPACYVSQVTYGRIFYLLIETTASREELQASVKASFQAAVSGGEIEGGAKYVSELENSRVKVFALGGDPEKALATFSGDFEAVRTFLTEGGDITTGRPLSYSVRTVADNRLVRVKVASDYETVECQPAGSTLENPIVWYNASFGIEKAGMWVNRWQDSFGNPNLDALPRTLDGSGLLARGDVNNRKDAVQFQFAHGLSEARAGFSGSGFRNTDYTVFAVVFNVSNPDDDLFNAFLWGETDAPQRGIRLAFSGDRSISMSHGEGLTLTADVGVPTQRYRLYTFRFSQANGMEIFVDGARVGADPSITDPVVSFSGASLGAADEDGFPSQFLTNRIAEFRAFGIAATDQQREAIEREILIKYGL